MMGNISAYSHLYGIQPLLVQVELTEACNLACRFCYNSQKPLYNNNVYEMMSALHSQGVMQLTLTGGEPLMHPDFFGILSKATELFPNVMILSNGSLMTDDVVTKICDINPMCVSVSIHGTEQAHDDLTKTPGSYSYSIQAIKKYIELGKVPIASNFVLNAKNAKVLPQTVYAMKDIGLKFMTITRFIPVGIGCTAKDLEISYSEILEAMEFANGYMRENKYPHIEFAEAMPFCIVPEHLQHLANNCSYGYDRFYVNVKGDLMVCGLSRIPLGGNILTTPLAEIKDKSTVFADYVSHQHVPATCIECGKYELCHGGCRAAAMRDGIWRGTPDSLISRDRRLV